MSILLCLSVVAFQALRLLPEAVLYGIFLYIGVASLYGVQVQCACTYLISTAKSQMCICTLNVMQSFPQKLKVERQQNTVVLLFGENPDVMIYVHIYVRVYVRALPHSIPNQFVQRLLLFIIPDKYKPDYEYLRHIPNRKIYLYTLVQVAFLGLLCVFKVVSQISIVFPVMVCTCTCTCTYNNTCIHMSGFSCRHSGKGGGGGGGQVEFWECERHASMRNSFV